MSERRPVEMVRLEQPEEVYDVEAVLGRDAASVFPSLGKDADPLETLKASIGAKRFVTEKELDEIKKARGLSVDDGTASADKPLAEILAERKKAKQEAFEEQWKQMKTGKNRPLDPDEMEFLDTLARQEAEQQARVSAQEAEELDAYRRAVAAAAEAKAAAAADADAGEATATGADADADPTAAAGPGPGSSEASLPGRTGSGGSQLPAAAAARRAVSAKPISSSSKLVLKPVVKVKPKNAAAAGSNGAAGGNGSSGAAAAGADGPDNKRPRLESGSGANGLSGQQREQQTSPVGLAGLLGGYASDSE